jgi:hypothetical protein
METLGLVLVLLLKSPCAQLPALKSLTLLVEIGPNVIATTLPNTETTKSSNPQPTMVLLVPMPPTLAKPSLVSLPRTVPTLDLLVPLLTTVTMSWLALSIDVSGLLMLMVTTALGLNKLLVTQPTSVKLNTVIKLLDAANKT